MKAITILEPWASLIACGAKKIETRSWSTSYRGIIAIHAGKSKKHTIGVMAEFNGIKLPDDFSFNYGKVIAVAELVDCVQFTHTMIPKRNTILLNGVEVPQNELAFGNCIAGNWGWVLENVQRIEPVPARGQQRIWNLNAPAAGFQVLGRKEFMAKIEKEADTNEML